MAALILPFNGARITHFFTARAGTFEAMGAGIDDFVALTRRRLATQRKRMAQARRWTTAIGIGIAIAIAIVPWAVWVFYMHREAYAREPWRAVLGFGTIVLSVQATTPARTRVLANEGPHARLGFWLLDGAAEVLTDQEQRTLAALALSTLETCAPLWQDRSCA